MKRVYSAEEKRKLTLIKFVGPILMLIVAFYILRLYFDLTPFVAGLIAIAVAGADYMVLAALLARKTSTDSDNIG
ncbi:hypothetical protein GCM10009069_14440 [Algimonas arctica]|uniref:Uncharacterized protein n=1 Tax=Algimonas arctica TaxID=1479486 RepID=A0A8J3CPP2_9PROT|nr:hypothetical protein [Algimonas arctica]GHA92533.1 hypothetical protein GCM10009069_14440 [Algimonas arctica]